MTDHDRLDPADHPADVGDSGSSARRQPQTGRVYTILFRRVLSRMPAEAAHRVGFGLIRAAGAIPGVREVLRRWLSLSDPVLRLTVFGRTVPGPLGLAAGFDKDARGIDALTMIGFGFVEVGTVTARPQPGNPRPRMFRLPADRALVNRMGFNNVGAAAVENRLARRARRSARRGNAVRSPVTGINIGKSRVVDAADEAASVADYVDSTGRLARYADYLVVNVSSPNTPGLRDLQAVERLRPLLSEVVRAAGDTPVLVKIAPDLADPDIDAVADLALETGLAGVVATNTTIRRDDLSTDSASVEALGSGGLSGPPLADRSLEVLRRLYARVGDRLPLISVGGIESADQVWERLRAGATLVQGYTGFIYHGPFWPRRIHRELAARVRREGLGGLHEVIGGDPDPHV